MNSLPAKVSEKRDVCTLFQHVFNNLLYVFLLYSIQNRTFSNYTFKQDLKMNTKQPGAKINMDSLERQKLLARQALEQLQELWEERKKDKNEIKSLQKRIEQQQEDIHKLTVEKEKQCISIKQMQSQLLAQNASKATGEKHLIQKIQFTAHQEKVENAAQSKNSEDSLVGGHRITLEQLQRLIIKTQKVVLETKQEKEQIQKIIDSVKQEIQVNKKYVTQQKSQNEHMKLNISENIKKLKKGCTEIQMQKPEFPKFQSREESERNDSFDNLKIKLQALLEETNRLCFVQEQQEMIEGDKYELKTETIQMRKQETETNLPCVQPVNDDIKRAKDQIKREKEDRDRQVAIAETEAIKCEREDIKKERAKLADQFEKTKNKIREMEVLSIEIDGKKRELNRVMRMSRRKKDEKCEICESENARREMEVKLTSEGQQSPRKSIEVNLGDRLDAEERCFDGAQTRGQQEAVVLQANLGTSTNSKDISTMQRVALEVQELRKMLTRVRENTEKRQTQTSKENNQTKGELTPQDGSSKQAENIKEENNFTSERANMQQQRRMVEKHVQQTKQVIQQMMMIKLYIQKAAAEISNTKEEMIKTQRMMRNEKVMIGKYMVSKKLFITVVTITSLCT